MKEIRGGRAGPLVELTWNDPAVKHIKTMLLLHAFPGQAHTTKWQASMKSLKNTQIDKWNKTNSNHSRTMNFVFKLISIISSVQISHPLSDSTWIFTYAKWIFICNEDCHWAVKRCNMVIANVMTFHQTASWSGSKNSSARMTKQHKQSLKTFAKSSNMTDFSQVKYCLCEIYYKINDCK